MAEQQGKYLAKLFNSGMSTAFPPFQFHSKGMLAYVGRFGGKKRGVWENFLYAFVYPSPSPPSGVATLGDATRFSMSGFSAWLVWRAAYLTKLGSWRNRLQVPLDWFKAFFVGRDTSRV